MCWPLTKQWRPHSDDKGDREAAAPGGPAGAMRRSDRGRRRGCSWRAGMIDAARRGKARATAGCAQAPDLKPQAGTRASEQAVWIRWKTRDVKVLFRQTEKTKPVCHGRRGSTSRLRDDLERDAVVGQQATEQMSRESPNAVEDRAALARLPRELHHCREKRDQHQRRCVVRHNQTIPQRLDQTEFEGTDGLDGEKVPLILCHDGPPNGTG